MNGIVLMLMGGCWHGCSKDVCCKFQCVL